MKPEEALPYLESGELDLMFGFAHMEADCVMTDFLQRPFSLKKLKRAFSEWQEKLCLLYTSPGRPDCARRRRPRPPGRRAWAREREPRGPSR